MTLYSKKNKTINKPVFSCNEEKLRNSLREINKESTIYSTTSNEVAVFLTAVSLKFSHLELC